MLKARWAVVVVSGLHMQGPGVLTMEAEKAINLQLQGAISYAFSTHDDEALFTVLVHPLYLQYACRV